jgi:hypothetical protein
MSPAQPSVKVSARGGAAARAGDGARPLGAGALNSVEATEKTATSSAIGTGAAMRNPTQTGCRTSFDIVSAGFAPAAPPPSRISATPR